MAQLFDSSHAAEVWSCSSNSHIFCLFLFVCFGQKVKHVCYLINFLFWDVKCFRRGEAKRKRKKKERHRVDTWLTVIRCHTGFGHF